MTRNITPLCVKFQNLLSGYQKPKSKTLTLLFLSPLSQLNRALSSPNSIDQYSLNSTFLTLPRNHLRQSSARQSQTHLPQSSPQQRSLRLLSPHSSEQ
uniref:Uncharacterized protein n=1 Tax=Salix viminalis TaxID=40686 RepID=A0A6N2K985_SALVM